jgi:DNA polymerase III epsilon subunit-like protein
MGVFDYETRINQTLDTLRILREKVPGAIIVLTDSSPNNVDDSVLGQLSKYSNLNIMFQQDRDLVTLANAGLKSQAENVLLHKTISLFKSNPDLMRVMSSVKRVYKMSGRTNLTDNFDIARYDDPALYGKYTFKKRMYTWLPIDAMAAADVDHLLITRMYSMCISLLDNYYQILPKMFKSINEYGIDTEHAHYKHIDKQYLIEFDEIYCQGTMASTGMTETY